MGDVVKLIHAFLQPFILNELKRINIAITAFVLIFAM
jgi:hypothetical protein